MDSEIFHMEVDDERWTQKRYSLEDELSEEFDSPDFRDFDDSASETLGSSQSSIYPFPNQTRLDSVQDLSGKLGPSDFELTRVLGKGGFGKVFQVKKTSGFDSGGVFAMKIMKKSVIIKNPKETQHTKAERNILGSVKSDFICKLFYAFQTDEKLYLVMEFLEGGELFMLLEREQCLSEEDSGFYAAEIIIALEHLHAHGVIYRDLKPENVMLDKFGHVKLTDLGLCKEAVHVGDRTYTYCGTVEYMSPEVILKTGHNQTADWWSLGTIIYDMIVGQPPFIGENNKETSEKIVNGRLKFPADLSKDAKALLRGLMKKDATKRLGFRGSSQIKKQQFFKNMDWKNVEERKLKPPFSSVQKADENTSFKYFDPRFFKLPAIDSPADKVSILDDPFTGFSYIAPEFFESKVVDFYNDQTLSYSKTSKTFVKLG